MSAIGEFDFYSDDYKKFAATIGQLFKVNLDIQFFDNLWEDEMFEKSKEFIDLGNGETFSLKVSHCRYDESKPSYQNSYCTYELDIPVELKYENELTIEFIPNSIFELRYLPFSNAWQFFIEDILGVNDSYYYSHANCVNEILKVRDCYIDILKKINCSQVIILADGRYKTVDRYIYDIKPNKIDKLQDIIDNISQLDNITLLNFIKAVKQEQSAIKTIKTSSYFNVAFLDNFADKCEFGGS